jgi:hypothetical protein
MRALFMPPSLAFPVLCAIGVPVTALDILHRIYKSSAGLLRAMNPSQTVDFAVVAWTEEIVSFMHASGCA